MIGNFQTIFYTSVFIVPGYLLYSTIEALTPRMKSNLADNILKFLTITLIHYILWSWPIWLMFNNTFFQEYYFVTFILAIIIVIISPCLLGLIVTKLHQKKTIINILIMLGYNPINPIPTAWDYKLSKMKEITWIIVGLKDDKKFYGKFSTKSYASSKESERDIYIEEVFALEKGGCWKKHANTDGVLIKGDQIRFIEFINN